METSVVHTRIERVKFVSTSSKITPVDYMMSNTMYYQIPISNEESNWFDYLISLPPQTLPENLCNMHISTDAFSVQFRYKTYASLKMNTYCKSSDHSTSFLLRFKHMITPRYSMLKLTAFELHGEQISRLFIFRMMLRSINSMQYSLFCPGV